MGPLKLKYIKPLVILFVICKTFVTDSAADLIAEGFWLNSGSRTNNPLTDPGNGVYHFKASTSDSVTIRLCTSTGNYWDYEKEPDCYLMLYRNTSTSILEQNDNENVWTNYSLIKFLATAETTYTIVATTESPNMIGRYFLTVEGNVERCSLRIATPIKVLSANQNATSVENGRAVCIHANVDLYYKNNRPLVIYTANGDTATMTRPYPYYFSANSVGTKQCKVKFVLGSESVESNISIQVYGTTTEPNTWKQNEFIISAWADPAWGSNEQETFNFIQDWLNAGFNFMTGVTTGNPGSQLRRVVYQNTHGSTQIQTLIEDSDMKYNGLEKYTQEMADNIDDALESYSETELGTDKRNALAGYFIGDEPNHITYSSCFSIMELVASQDPQKLAYFNFGNPPNDWNSYACIVKTYMNSPWAKVFSSTQYVFNSKSDDGYSEHDHFRRYHLYANEIKNSGYKVNFWGFARCSERISSDNTCHRPYPFENMLRYNAYGPIVFGAKGIIWYVYNTDTGTNQTQIHAPTVNGVIDTTDNNQYKIYDNVLKINHEIKRMAPVLMKLKWIGTFHGAATDPSSGEGNLPVNLIDPVYSIERDSTNIGTWSDDSLCVGVHTDGKSKYLTIFNKSMSFNNSTKNYFGYDNISKVTVNGSARPLLFDKSTGKWEVLENTYNSENKRTSFIVNTKQGDMNLIWVSDGSRILPSLDLLLKN